MNGEIALQGRFVPGNREASWSHKDQPSSMTLKGLPLEPAVAALRVSPQLARLAGGTIRKHGIGYVRRRLTSAPRTSGGTRRKPFKAPFGLQNAARKVPEGMQSRGSFIGGLSRFVLYCSVMTHGPSSPAGVGGHCTQAPAGRPRPKGVMRRRFPAPKRSRLHPAASPEPREQHANRAIGLQHAG